MKNIKINKITLLIALLVLVSSCLKDDRTDFSNVGEVIEMLDAIPGGSTALSLDPTKDTVIMVRVNQTGADATTEDIVVTLGISQHGLDLYNLNTAHVAGSLLPDSAFSYPKTVTIKAGKDSLGNKNRVGSFPLTIHSSKLPSTPGVNYVLSLGITSTSPSMTISGNIGAILFNFYHNPYDGSYHRTGTLVRAGNPTDIIDEDGDLVTVNATTSSTIASFFGNTGLSFFIVVNSDNSVTIKSDPNALYPITANGPCNYNPATKTFTLSYTYTSSASRKFSETWVHN